MLHELLQALEKEVGHPSGGDIGNSVYMNLMDS